MSKSYCSIKLYSNFPINDYFNQTYYSNSNIRDNIFDSYCSNKKGIDYYTDIASPNKTSMSFRLETNYKNAMNYNYGVIIEDDKRYYFFINSIDWSSNLITATFNCEVDWWQTYCYDITFKKSFVEREHVSDDTFGKHIYDENIPISDYIVADSEMLNMDKDKILFCVTVSDNSYVWQDSNGTRPASLYITTENGLNWQTLTLGFTKSSDASNFINGMVSNNKIDSIIGYYLAPVDGVNRFQVWCGDNLPDSYWCTAWQVFPNGDYDTYTINRKNNIDGYIPRNNKCFTYPYNFVNITNNQGNSIIGKFEFSNDLSKIFFNYNFPTQEGASCNGYLYNYNNVKHNLDYSISGALNIELPYNTNAYSAYYSANANSINNSYAQADRNYDTSITNATISAIGQVGSSAMTLDPIKLAQSGINAIGNQITSINSASNNQTNAYESINATLRDQKSKGNIQHGSFNVSIMQNINQVGFKAQTYQVKKEYIEMIDNYFDMFGYKVNIIKVPQFNSRPSWNYIKTNGVNLIGNVPQIALNTIKKMFNNGTTIWHNIKTMYDYSNNNK